MIKLHWPNEGNCQESTSAASAFHRKCLMQIWMFQIKSYSLFAFFELSSHVSSSRERYIKFEMAEQLGSTVLLHESWWSRKFHPYKGLSHPIEMPRGQVQSVFWPLFFYYGFTLLLTEVYMQHRKISGLQRYSLNSVLCLQSHNTLFLSDSFYYFINLLRIFSI